MLAEYALKNIYPMRAIEKIFSTEIISDKYAEIEEDCKEYIEKILVEILLYADENQIEIGDDNISDLDDEIEATLKLSLYHGAIQKIIDKGDGDLITELRNHITIPNVKDALSWLRTKTGRSQLLATVT